MTELGHRHLAEGGLVLQRGRELRIAGQVEERHQFGVRQQAEKVGQAIAAGGSVRACHQRSVHPLVHCPPVTRECGGPSVVFFPQVGL